MSIQWILLNNEKDWVGTYNNMGEPQVYYTKWKKPHLNGNIVYHSYDTLKKAGVQGPNSVVVVRLWVKGNYKETQGKISGCRY